MIILVYKSAGSPYVGSATRDSGRELFDVWLDDQPILKGCRSPLYDGARRLLELGYAEDSLMTTRSASSQHNSWQPNEIKRFAKLSVSEGVTYSVRSAPWAQREFLPPPPPPPVRKNHADL